MHSHRTGPAVGSHAHAVACLLLRCTSECFHFTVACPAVMSDSDAVPCGRHACGCGRWAGESKDAKESHVTSWSWRRAAGFLLPL